jgi:hypothetical protein
VTGLPVGATRSIAALAILALIPGCKAIGQITGVAAGLATGTATGSPAAGFAVGIATNAGVDALVKWIGRSRQGAEQDAIAAVAGSLAVGESRPWRIRHTIPIGNEHGALRVVREIANPLTACKEVVFSVDEGSPEAPRQRQLFTTAVCWQGTRWKWAAAEPAVQRWGYLQ